MIGEKTPVGGKGTNALTASKNSGTSNILSGPIVGPIGNETKRSSGEKGADIDPTEAEDGTLCTNAKSCLNEELETNG